MQQRENISKRRQTNRFSRTVFYPTNDLLFSPGVNKSDFILTHNDFRYDDEVKRFNSKVRPARQDPGRLTCAKRALTQNLTEKLCLSVVRRRPFKSVRWETAEKFEVKPRSKF